MHHTLRLIIFILFSPPPLLLSFHSCYSGFAEGTYTQPCQSPTANYTLVLPSLAFYQSAFQQCHLILTVSVSDYTLGTPVQLCSTQSSLPYTILQAGWVVHCGRVSHTNLHSPPTITWRVSISVPGPVRQLFITNLTTNLLLLPLLSSSFRLLALILRSFCENYKQLGARDRH